MKFKVGDIVKIHKDYAIKAFRNLQGKIVITTLDTDYGVKFTGLSPATREEYAHDLDGFLTKEEGRWFREYHLEKINTHICGLICKCNAKEAVTF